MLFRSPDFVPFTSKFEVLRSLWTACASKSFEEIEEEAKRERRARRARREDEEARESEIEGLKRLEGRGDKRGERRKRGERQRCSFDRTGFAELGSKGRKQRRSRSKGDLRREPGTASSSIYSCPMQEKKDLRARRRGFGT